MSPLDALHHYFGFSDFRPGQSEAIAQVLAGRDTLVVMPTGSGKSLIYQLSALLLPHTTLVISPLVALMKDQVDGLTRRHIAATFINSSLDATEQSQRLRALADGRYKIVLVAPERLRSRDFRLALTRVPLSQLAIDEAHCLSQWGHDFRPDYLHLAAARSELHPTATLALTATATPRVQDDIVHLLGLDHAERLVMGFNRPNLTFEVLSTPGVKDKLQAVQDLLGAVEGAGIIYTGTRHEAEDVAEFVREGLRLRSEHYHAALDTRTRARVQDAFMAGDLPVVVATNAFGMGIDRPDVRWVLHYTLPGTLEAYYQEAGRAGRDGLPARAILLYAPKDTALHEFFIENDAPSPADLRAVHDFLQARGARVHAQLHLIERSLGLHQIKTRVALEQLELAGALRRAPERALDVLDAEVLPLPDGRLEEIAAQVAARREHKRKLLESIVGFAESNACRRRTLLDYFGDHSPAEALACCDNCLSRALTTDLSTTKERAAQTQAERAALIALDTLAHLKWEIGQSTLAQILKGSTAQRMRYYQRARNFGKLNPLRLREIQSLVEQLCTAGYVKSVGADRPTLRLTPRGEETLKARVAIHVEVRALTANAVRRHAAAREAGSTLALTEQLHTRGLSPGQMAAERGLTVGTIYSHLAQLIAAGRVDVNNVVPADVQAQVRHAIEQVGAVGYLAPIQARLPEALDYSVIRCVVEAWKREQSVDKHPSSVQPRQELDLPFSALRRWRDGKAAELSIPPYYLFGDWTLQRIVSARPTDKQELHPLLGLGVDVIEKYGDEIIRALNEPRTTEVNDAIIACVRSLPGTLPRSGVAKVLVGSGSERVAEYRSHPLYNHLAAHYWTDVTKQVDVLLERGLLTQDTSGHLLLAGCAALPAASAIATVAQSTAGRDTIASFLSRSHARPLAGPWLAGWALDFHSRFDGDQNSRSQVGELVYRFKYRGEHTLAHELAAQWVQMLAAHPQLPRADVIVPVPPSTPRAADPVTLLAQSLAAALRLPLVNTLVKTRVTRPQKVLTSFAQKQANVRGAFALKGDVRGKHCVLVDDLFDSGATLHEAALVLARGGAKSIVVLTLTKTIHSDL